jgi:hypothetical protein
VLSDRTLLCACCLLVVVAGCVGGPSGDGARSPTPPATDAVDRPAAVPGDATVVPYSNLTPTQRRAFDDAVAGGRVSLLDGGAWGAPDRYYSYGAVFGGWPERVDGGNTAYVWHNGTYYRVTFDEPRCCVGPGTAVRLAGVRSPGERTVVHLGNRSGRAWEFLGHAVERGGWAEGWQVDVPIDGETVVEYRGEHYEVVSQYVVDFGRASMSVAEIG